MYVSDVVLCCTCVWKKNLTIHLFLTGTIINLPFYTFILNSGSELCVWSVWARGGGGGASTYLQGFSGEPNRTSRASIRMCFTCVWSFSCTLRTKPYLRCLLPKKGVAHDQYSSCVATSSVVPFFFLHIAALVGLEIASRGPFNSAAPRRFGCSKHPQCTFFTGKTKKNKKQPTNQSKRVGITLLSIWPVKDSISTRH